MKKDQAGKTAAKLAKDRAWLPEPLATWATPAGEAAAARPVDARTTAQAMADAIAADEAAADEADDINYNPRRDPALQASLQGRVAAWLQTAYGGVTQPGARLEKLYVAHRKFVAADGGECDEGAFETALFACGCDVRDWRGKRWIFAGEGPAQAEAAA